MKLICTLFLTCSCASFSCSQLPISDAQINSPTPQAHPSIPQQLTESQAIELAEKFVAQNGYTDLLPSKENLSYESIEWESNVDVMLKNRSDTLEKKAFGLTPRRKNDAPGWTVVFRYAHPSDSSAKKNGRAVTMDVDGSDLRVEHVDFILEKVGKKL